MLHIFVDADACPVKNEVYRVARRCGLEVTLVANSHMRIPDEDWVTLQVVGGGFDEADDWIEDHVRPFDIVVTADVPLASRCVGIGIAHSYLGERFLVTRLLRREDLPRLFGDDSFTRGTIRFAWHLTTVAWIGIAAVLMILSGAVVGIPVAKAILLILGFTFIAHAVLALVFTRARHLSWVVFLGIAVLCFYVAS